MRLIDADMLKEAMIKACNTFEDFGIDTMATRVMISCIDNVPNVEVEPVRRAHWVHKSGVCREWLECPICGRAEHSNYEYEYCPKCGTKMGDKNA